MNRVILCGRLMGRPKASYTPTGVAVADFTILIAQEGENEAALVLPCVAFREKAQELIDWGERGYRVNLEGRLRNCAPDPGLPADLKILTDAFYFVDPVRDPHLRPAIPEAGTSPELITTCGG